MSARILVIEDNAANLELMTYLLGAFGYATSSATNGVAGWEAAEKNPYDLVLTDILMPDLDGYQFARRFKSNPQLRRIPLIAVTALAMTGDRDRIIASGFDGYISKPIDPKTFIGRIESFLTAGRSGQNPDR